MPPGGDWYVWMLLSGRGFGKTWVGSNMAIEYAQTNPKYPIALVGQTKADVRDTMVEIGESAILNQSSPWFMPDYEPSKRRLTWPNGAVAMIYSGDEPGQLRGPQHGFAWVDELSKFKYPTETWDMLEMGVRIGPDPRIVVTNTPRPIPVIKMLVKDPETAIVQGSTYENISNLNERFLRRIRGRYEGTRLGRQELHGQLLDDNPNALWRRGDIEGTRVTEIPQLIRIVVAIDPQAVSNEDTSDTGIVVAGLGRDQHGYILDDLTIDASPDGWGRAAVAGYNKYKADRVVAETNHGGEMVEHVIRTVSTNVAFKSVRASKNKYIRAEPVAALYEQGKVHHVGMFAELEDQMCQWEPGLDSPDRLDALVWGLTELMLGDNEPLTVTTQPYARMKR